MGKAEVVKLFDRNEFVVVVDSGRFSFFELFGERVEEAAPARRRSQIGDVIVEHLLILAGHEHHAAIGDDAEVVEISCCFNRHVRLSLIKIKIKLI